MKQKITFPNWTGAAAVKISSSTEDSKRYVWSEYQQTADDLLSLYVTVEIAGGLTLPGRFGSAEERDAAWREEDRRAAWANALAFAERLWRGGTHREFVVMFEPENQNTGREKICIYRRLPEIINDKKAVHCNA